MDKVLLITGASRGIGAATARAAGRTGYQVVVNYATRRDDADSVVRDIEAAGGTAVALKGDVGAEEDVLGLFGEIDRRFGRLDALVNNAGISTKPGRLDQLTAADLRRVFEVNTFGAFLCAREAVRRMSTAQGGRGGVIVNVSSGAATIGSAGEFVHYAASKGALNTMTIGLAKEVGREGIRVCAVEPGLIETEFHDGIGAAGRIDRLLPTVPMGRGAPPEEVAEPILFLLSDAASYMTGAIIRVSGGR